MIGYPVETKDFCDSLCGMFPEKYEVPHKKDRRETAAYIKSIRDFVKAVKKGEITNPHPKL